LLHELSEREQRGASGSVEEAVRALCQHYESGRLSAAGAMAKIAEVLQMGTPATEAALGPVEVANLSNGFRFYRTDHKGAGWQASVCVEGKRYFKYFPDSAYGSAEASRGAAEEFASRNRELHQELWALRNRFAVRKNSRSGIPGVSRYEGDAKRGPYWSAYWADPKTGRRLSKRFSVGEHGESAALALAVRTREKAVQSCRERYAEILVILGLTGEDPTVQEGAGRKADTSV
jgi:hypothetical protein